MNTQLNIGDKIGFVTLSNDTDGADKVIFFSICEVTTRDGERAYRYQYPDGEISRSAIRESEVFSSHVIKIERMNPKMICLHDRDRSEIKAALKRGFENEFEVFADWDRDSFVIVNHTNQTEYRVKLTTSGGRTFSECSCKDFIYRKHVCKHIAEVLQFTLFGAAV
ncbi:MAG TPA: SWIM zinc finger family protein [Pyrinomonadaceae bacterium]|jgi:hypothetical protein